MPMLAVFKKSSDWFRKQLINKYMGLEERFLWWVGESKHRIKRIRQHISNGKDFYKAPKSGLTTKERLIIYANWWGILFIYLLELGGVPEIYQFTADIIKFNTRPLSNRETELAQAIFGDAISYELVRIDEKAWFGTKGGKQMYVSFHTINSSGKMPDSVLIHELVHVWQYEQIGAVYIPRALAAQKTPQNYNYGGLEVLKEQAEQGLKAFNLEQQADIITDYYKIKNGLKPAWSNGTKKDLPLYEPYVQEIRNSAHEN